MKAIQTLTRDISSSGTETQLEIPEDIRRDILLNIDDFCRSVRKVDPEIALSFILAESYLAVQADFYRETFDEAGIDPRSIKILEIGSGFGFFLAYARRFLKWNVFGVEPGEDEFGGRDAIAARVLSANGVDPKYLSCCTGEHLSFPDASFDAVISNDVVEHVADPEAVFRESARILKPGGLLVFNIPNFNWIYEGHYNTPWIPGMPKTLARGFVSLLGRDPKFIDVLNFLSGRVVTRMVQNIPDLDLLHPLDHRSADFMSLRIQAYIKSQEDSRNDWRLQFFRMLRRLLAFAPFRDSMANFAHLTGIYHEMHVIARKRGFLSGSRSGSGLTKTLP